MDYGRAAEILGRRKWLIAFSVLITMILTWGATRLTGAKWTTTVKLIVPSVSPLTDAPNSRSDTGAMDARSQATMYTTVAKSLDVVEGALKTAKVPIPPRALGGNIEFEAAGARMFELRVTDASPSRAETLANAVADSFVDKVHQLTTQQAQSVVTLLEDQQREEDVKLASIRARYDAYCARHEVLGNPASQLALIFKRLELARQGRDEAEARLADAESRLSGRTAQLGNTPASVTEDRAADMRPLVRQLEDELARKETALIDLQAKYTEKDPRVLTAVNARDQMQKRLNEERGKHETGRQQNPAYAPLKQNVEELKQEVASQKAVIAQQQENIAHAEAEIRNLRGLDSPLAVLTSEITAGTEARQSIATRLNSARAALDVAEQQNPLVVLEKGSPSNPPVNMTAGRTKKLTIMAALAALLIACGLSIAFDSMDRRLKTVQEAEVALPARVLSAIPAPTGEITARSLPRVTEQYPLSQHAEAYRFLAQHILNTQGKPIRSLITLSARPGQGSTNTIANLGITLAQSGHRVILVDANTRNPRLHEIFDIPNDFGLTNALENPEIFAVQRALHATSVANLWVMPSGPASENPWELLSSQRLTEVAKYLLERADYILYDTPSATTFADTLNLAAVADAALFSVRALEPLTGEEARLVERFEQAGVTVLGSVLSHVPMSLLDSYRISPSARMRPLAAAASVRDEPFENIAIGEQTPPPTEPQPVPQEEREVVPIPVTPIDGPSLLATLEPENEPEKEIRIADDANAATSGEHPIFTSGDELTPVDSENQEIFMTTGTLPHTEFPRAMSGYAPSAVEEYVRLANTRIDMMQKQLDQQATLTSRLMDEKDRLSNELESARNRMTGVLEKEASIASAILMTEQRRVQIEQEMATEHEATRREIEQMKAQVQTETEAAIGQARQQAAALIEEARLHSAEVNARTTAQLTQAEQNLAEARRKADEQQQFAEQIEQQIARLQHDMEAERNAGYAEAERIRAQARAEADRMMQEAHAHIEAQRTAELEVERASFQAEAAQLRAQSHAEIEQFKAQAREEAERLTLQARQEATSLLEEAKKHAEEMSMYAAAAHAAHEERLQSLSSECDEIVLRTRRALEAQLALLPQPASADNARSALQEALSATARLEAHSTAENSPAPHGDEWPEGGAYRNGNGNYPRSIS